MSHLLPCRIFCIVCGGGKKLFGDVLSEFKLLKCNFSCHSWQDGYFDFYGKAVGEFEGDKIAQFGEVFERRYHF